LCKPNTNFKYYLGIIDPYNKNNAYNAFAYNLFAVVIRYRNKHDKNDFIRENLTNVKVILMKDYLIHSYKKKMDFTKSIAFEIDLSKAEVAYINLKNFYKI